jgi:hypothetical protein
LPELRGAVRLEAVHAARQVTGAGRPVLMLPTNRAPTSTTTNGPYSPSKAHTMRSLRANSCGTRATLALLTENSRPGMCQAACSRPASGICTRW